MQNSLQEKWAENKGWEHGQNLQMYWVNKFGGTFQNISQLYISGLSMLAPQAGGASLQGQHCQAILAQCYSGSTPSPFPSNKDKQVGLIKSQWYHFQLSINALIWEVWCLKECCDQCNIRSIIAVTVLRDVFLFPGSLYVFRYKTKESAAANTKCAEDICSQGAASNRELVPARQLPILSHSSPSQGLIHNDEVCLEILETF